MPRETFNLAFEAYSVSNLLSERVTVDDISDPD